MLTESGLFNLSESNRLFDTFKNRIMFPLKNEFGKTIGFSGRVWTKDDIEKGKPSTKIQGLPVFSISLMNFITSIRLNQ